MILRRALHKELMFYVTAIYLVLVLVTLTFTLIRLLGQASAGRIDPQSVFILTGFSLINYQALLLSFATFLAVLLVFTRMWRDSEMAVWFSSGVSLWQFIVPVLRFALPIALFAGVFSTIVSPWALRQAQEYRERYEKRNDLARIAPGQFRESANGARVFYVESSTENLQNDELVEGKVNQVFLALTDPKDASKPKAVVLAEQGRTYIDEQGNRQLLLQAGRRYEQWPGQDSLRWMQFESYQVLLKERARNPNAVVPLKQRNTLDLLRNLQRGERGELLWRIAAPLNTLLLALLAVPLSYFNPRSGRAAPMIAAILLFLIILNFTTVAQNMVNSGRWRFEAALLGPALMVLSLTLLLMLKRTGQLRWPFAFRRRA